MLLTTLIMQQQAALTNIHTARLIVLSDKDDPISDKPPTSSIPIKILCVEKCWVSTLISDPPTRYPKALTKNMYENEVSEFPVAAAK